MSYCATSASAIGELQQHRTGRAALAGVAALLLLIVVAARAAAPVMASIPASGTYRLETLDQWDEHVAELREVIWNMHSASPQAPRAPDGRTLAAYVDRWLLPAEVDTELGNLRQSAQAARDRGDADAETKLIGAAGRLIELQLRRAVLIGGFWNALYRVEEQRAALAPLLARTSTAERDSIERRNAQLMTPLQPLLDDALTANDTTALAALVQPGLDLDSVLGSYNEERLRLVRLLDKEDPPAVPPRAWTRDTSCPAAATRTSGRADPSFDKASVTELHYPVDARRASFEASITLAAEVSATGCLERIAIAGSSGTATLDQAALDWARGLSYLPGERDGRAVAGSVQFAITFRLSDDDDSLPPRLDAFDVLPGRWDALGPQFCADPGVLSFNSDRSTMAFTLRQPAQPQAPGGASPQRFTVLGVDGNALHLRRDAETEKDQTGQPVTWHLQLLDRTRFCWRRNDAPPRACSAPAIRRCPTP